MDESWTDLLINSQALAGLYDGEPPLEDFELQELQLESRGPACLLCGELPEFPHHPKSDWNDGATRLQIRLNLSAVEHFEARGQAAGGTVDLTIERSEEVLGVVIGGEGEQFEFEAVGVTLQVIGLKPL